MVFRLIYIDTPEYIETPDWSISGLDPGQIPDPGLAYGM
jgi:hypothetical protein